MNVFSVIAAGSWTMTRSSVLLFSLSSAACKCAETRARSFDVQNSSNVIKKFDRKTLKKFGRGHESCHMTRIVTVISSQIIQASSQNWVHHIQT
jgi:hypothetical protein